MSQGFPGNNPYDINSGAGGFRDVGPPPRRGRSSSAKTVLIILGIVGGGGILLCCGGTAALLIFGMNVAEAEVAAQLRDNPLLRDKLGEIQSCKTIYSESLAEEDDDTFVYRIEGTKGSGKATVTTDWDSQITFAKLRMPDGEEIVLVGE